MLRPPFTVTRSNLCCCHETQDGAAGDRAGDGAADDARLWFTTPAYTEGPDPERKSPAELAELTDRQAIAERRRSEMNSARRKHEETGAPVYFVNKCNGARDCLSSEGWQGPLPASRRNAQAWVLPDPKRTVEIYSAPGGTLLEIVVNNYGGSVEQRTQDKTELEQRRLASEDVLRGNLG